MRGASHNSAISANEALLRVRVPRFSYGERITLHAIELCFSEPGIVALVGPNGSGKSTLLRLAAGLLRAEGTEVSVLGQSVAGLSERSRAALIAWVPQRAEPAFSMRVIDLVRVGRYRHRRKDGSGPAGREAIRESLRSVGMESLAGREVDTLSGGEWQRALLARALAQETPVLLLDEPVAGLDLHHQEEAYRLFRRLAGEGKLVFVADHHIELAASYADRILMLCDGVLVGDGPPGQVLTRERVAQTFGVQVEVFADPVTGTPRLSRPRTTT